MRCVGCARAFQGPCFVQFSPGNIKLRRCEGCGGVLDKYVELEALLVAVDVLLHKGVAHRHLIFNVERTRPWERLVWALVSITVMEFYMRMYYFDEARITANAIVYAAAASVSCVTLSLPVAFLFARIWKEVDVIHAVMAIALGSSVKVLFVVMSIWTYPREFLVLLRALSWSCTAVAFRALMNGEFKPDRLWLQAGIISALITALHSLGLVEE